MTAAARDTLRRPLCAEESWAREEPLTATASFIEHWILVEYRRLWSRDVIRGSGLPDAVKEHLRAQLAALPRSRLLFVRRPDRRDREGYAVYYGRTAEEDRSLYELEIADYDDLLGLDVPAALAGRPAGSPVERPLLVVCTHGKRDRCCAKFGRPLFDALCAEGDPGYVWQSTHVGGDRFAGNVVTLPAGLYFGRVEWADVPGLLAGVLEDRIPLERYRGRSCYGFAAQAAERRVREETRLDGVDDLRLAEVAAGGEDRWTVAFEAAGALHEVDVAARLAGDAVYLTCSSSRRQQPVRYVATGYRVRAR